MTVWEEQFQILEINRNDPIRANKSVDDIPSCYVDYKTHFLCCSLYRYFQLIYFYEICS